MMIAPLPADENQRLAALREYNILDTPPVDAYDDITRLAAFICGTPIAAITLIDAQRQWFKSVLGLAIAETSRDIAFCAHTILRPGLMVVPDAEEDERFRGNPLVEGEPKIRFYAGMPLTTEDGHALGSLCVIDTVPRHLSSEQEAALKTLGRQVINQLELTRNQLELARRVAAQERLIAERQQVQITLEVSELRYRRLFETAHDGILILDAQTAKITNANPFIAEMLGYAPDEFVGKELWEIGLLKDKAASQEAFRQLQQNGYIRYEGLPLETRRGERHAVEFISNVYAEGATSVIQCNIRDITERQAAEEALRASEQFAQATLNSLSAAIAILDSTGMILAVNEVWRQFAVDNPPSRSKLFKGSRQSATKGARHNAAVGTNYLHICDEAADQGQAGAKRVAAGIRAVSAGKQELFMLEYPFHSLLERRWFNLRATRFPGDGQARVVVSHENITERKQAELLLEEALTVAQVQADHDPLTNLFNHRVFHKRLDEEAARSQRGNTIFAVVMLDINNFKFFNDVYGHAAGDEVLRTVSDKLQAVCRSYDTIARFGGDEFALILPNVGPVTAGEIASRLYSDLGSLSYRPEDGEAIIPLTLSIGAALYPEASTNSHEVLRQADERLLWSKTGGAEGVARRVRLDASSRVQGFSMLDALVTAVDNKDRYTRKHSEDVMEYSLMIAREVGLSEHDQHTVAVAALLHDVGKIGVPDSILRKPGTLTSEEFEAVKQHPLMGAVMVGAVPGLEETLDAVRHHYERWDGAGYPYGLKGENTPQIARLMAVADAFSAMTTDRPYRKGMDRERALLILAEGVGTQWDPECVGTFLAVMRKGEQQ